MAGGRGVIEYASSQSISVFVGGCVCMGMCVWGGSGGGRITDPKRVTKCHKMPR